MAQSERGAFRNFQSAGEQKKGLKRRGFQICLKPHSFITALRELSTAKPFPPIPSLSITIEELDRDAPKQCLALLALNTVQSVCEEMSCDCAKI